MSNMAAFLLGFTVSSLSTMWLLCLGYVVWRATRKEARS